MRYLIFSFLFFSISTSSLSAQNGEALKQVIDQLLRRDNKVDSAKVTGFVIGCLDGDSSWVFPFGRLSKTSNEAPSGDTYFEIGGVSQVFIANQLYELVNKKQLDYEAPVNRYLPPALQFPMGERMTVLQLATHTSGLPKLPEDIGAFESDKDQLFETYTEGSLFNYLKDFDTTRLTANSYRYAPLNYAILEKMLEGKELSNFGKDTSSNKSYAQGYNLAQKPVEMARFNETFLRTLGRQMSVKQLLSFVKQQLAVEELHKPLYATNIGKFTSVGKAWHIIKESKRINVCVASGTTAGQSAFVAFVPATRTGVVVLTNSRLVAGKLGLAVLRVLNENWKRR
jgi:serine-type D-Ala-D-Ala carboxypeptidase/endopeptidase